MEVELKPLLPLIPPKTWVLAANGLKVEANKLRRALGLPPLR